MAETYDARLFRNEQERHRRNAAKALEDARVSVAAAIAALGSDSPQLAQHYASSAAASAADAARHVTAVTALNQVAFLAGPDG